MTKCQRGYQQHKGRCISIDKLIKKVGKNVGYENLFNGNCSAFAVGLKEVIGRGKLVGVVEENEPGYTHIGIKIDDFYYDGDGKSTKRELMGNDSDKLVEGLSELDVLNNTNPRYFKSPEYFEKQIRKEMDR